MLVYNAKGKPHARLPDSLSGIGIADCIAEQVTGSLGTNARLHVYGEAHEQALWLDFKQEMLGRDTRNWLANSTQETQEKPCDLGYYVGYKICQAYYIKSNNGQQAIAEMLNTKDFHEFLWQSDYDHKVKGRWVAVRCFVSS